MARRQRDAAKEHFWLATIKGQEQSRQSIRDYCDDRGLPEASFYHWRRELRRRDRKNGRPGGNGWRAARSKDSVAPGQRATFVPVRLVKETHSRDGDGQADSESAIEIILANGRRLRVEGGFERQTLLQVIAALESLGC